MDGRAAMIVHMAMRLLAAVRRQIPPSCPLEWGALRLWGGDGKKWSAAIRRRRFLRDRCGECPV